MEGSKTLKKNILSTENFLKKISQLHIIVINVYVMYVLACPLFASVIKFQINRSNVSVTMWNLHQFCSEMKGLNFIVFTFTIISNSTDAALIESTQLPSQKGNANKVSSLSIMNSMSNVCESVKKDETKLCACKKENASI